MIIGVPDIPAYFMALASDFPLDSTANWATVLLAGVATGFAIRQYGRLIVGRLKGMFNGQWPLDVEAVGAILAMVERRVDGWPRYAELSFELRVKPSLGAYNRSLPIAVKEIKAVGPMTFSGFPIPAAIAENIRTPVTVPQSEMRAVQLIGPLSVSTKAELVLAEELTLEVTVVQSPRTERICRAKFFVDSVARSSTGMSTERLREDSYRVLGRESPTPVLPNGSRSDL